MTALVDTATASQRLTGERQERLAAAAKLVPFEMSFLDDALGGITPNDLIVVTAKPGAGKTAAAATIAENAATRGRSVLMFALEAERREIERRIKYRALARRWFEKGAEARRLRREPALALSYGDWYLGRLDAEFGPFERDVDAELDQRIGSRLQTVYRNSGDFTVDDIERVMVATQASVDLFILDHLHFVDFSDEVQENAAVKAIMKRLRDLALRLSKPVIVVAHIRKADRYRPALVPSLDDIHGSSDIVKIATRVIALAPAPRTGPWWLAPTFMQVLKDRINGASSLVARVVFNTQTGAYAPDYELGVIDRGERGPDEFVPLERERIPAWAQRAIR